MKKLISTIKKALPIGMAIALSLPLFACKKAETPLATPEPTAIVTEQPTAAPTEAPEPTLEPEELEQAEIKMRVALYCAMLKQSIDELSARLEPTGMTVEAIAEGKDLVFKYTVSNSILGGITTSALRESLDVQGDTLKQTYDELASFTMDDSVRFVVRYVDSKGKTLINYIIDKNYEPINGSSVLDPNGYATLSELVESEYFRSQIEVAAGMSEFDVTASVEDETTLVISYFADRSLTQSELDRLKTEWEKSFKANGEETTEMMRTMIALLVPSVDTNELKLVYRMYSEDGSLIAEFRADHLPSDV